jgi:N-acetylglucosaminyldiphosphoundecaprenol N-acetyl-beta-D-mannosaminyltransferase
MLNACEPRGTDANRQDETPEKMMRCEASVPVPFRVRWPKKYNLFGVQLSATTYEEATDAILQAAQCGEPAIVSAHAVHAVVTASSDPMLREAVNRFQLVVPDGQPVRWALNLLHGTGLRDRVCGPELMLHVCRRAAEEGVPIFLYGSSPSVLAALERNLVARFPCLLVAGAESPPFRPLTDDEDRAMVERINASGAGILFIGLGCPKQDFFAYQHRDRIRAVQMCVGAAFDFHAGTKNVAPRWMQRCGLEWLFRLCEEPRRLWRRYLTTNSVFLARLAGAIACRPLSPKRHR